MPILSTTRHAARYVPPVDLDQRIEDIKVLLRSISSLAIGVEIKKRMLRQAIWEVTYAKGNAQGRAFGRYRSREVISTPGLQIQRDHIHEMKVLISLLLRESPDVERIVQLADCCVVTKDEHDRLTAIGKTTGGHARYAHAGVVVFDMLTERPIDWSTFPAPGNG